MSEGSRCV
jgi:hypothetical protein